MFATLSAAQLDALLDDVTSTCSWADINVSTTNVYFRGGVLGKGWLALSAVLISTRIWYQRYLSLNPLMGT